MGKRKVNIRSQGNQCGGATNNKEKDEEEISKSMDKRKS